MITTIISIGNSKGIRIPKAYLEESGLGTEVEIKVKKGELKIVPSEEKNLIAIKTLGSEKVLADWNKPEEDEAWANL